MCNFFHFQTGELNADSVKLRARVIYKSFFFIKPDLRICLSYFFAFGNFVISKSDIKRGFLLLSSMFHAKHVSFNAFFLLWLRFPLPDCVFIRQCFSLPFKF